MTTQQMEYFLSLAQKLNFSAVAERFFISQPTLSRQISNMERELNAQLFIRKNNTVYLTRAGEQLYAGLKNIYGNFQDLTRQVEDLGHSRAGQLHLERPDVQITIRRCLYDQLRNGLLDGDLDLINGLGCPEDHFLSGMTSLLCVDELPHLAVSEQRADHLPSQLTRAELEQLLRHVPILLPEGEGFAPPKDDPVGDLERNMSFSQPLRHVTMVKQLAAMPLYVSVGLGVAVTNQTAALALDPNIRMLPIIDGPAYPKVVAYRTLEQNPLMKDFVKLIHTA